MAQVRRFGSLPGQPGVVIFEQNSANALNPEIYGTAVVVGPFKRGPEGVPVPVRNVRQYHELFGDPSDIRWHLYGDARHLTPDFVDDFFDTSAGTGELFCIRLELENEGRPAEIVLNSRLGAPALRIKAANAGRWGGSRNVVSARPIVVATARTFTLVIPGAKSNEFIGASAIFSSAPNKSFKIISNRAADPVTGETIFTVSPQYNLLEDEISGPVALTGTAEYTTQRQLTGTVSFPATVNVTGTVNINGKVITGTGTEFLTELEVGRNVYYNGEVRAIESITSDTTLTIASAFSVDGTGVTLSRDNLVVTGTTTEFTDQLSVGDTLYIDVNGEREGRTIASIATDLSLTLTSGFTDTVTAGSSAYTDNLTVTGTGTAFNSEVTVGSYIVDPYRSGKILKVTAISSATSLTVEEPFSEDFEDFQLTKQAQTAAIQLIPERGLGLSVKVGQGQSQPETHFSLQIFFNGSRVLDIPDASLDPADPNFIESEVDQRNLAYTFNSRDHYTWIRAESLWTGEYTTSEDSDVRPTNGAGLIVHLEANRLYTVANLDYDYLVNEMLYPNPYDYPRSFYRIADVAKPLELDGTISSSGVNVTGTATTFTDDLANGDYLYDPNTGEARKVVSVQSDTAVVLETAFSVNVPAGTTATRAGYLDVDRSYDLLLQSGVGTRFMVTMPQELTGGYDGDLDNIIPFHYTRYANPDINILEKALAGQNRGLVRLACPGISDIAIQKQYVNFVGTMPAEFRCEIPSYITAAAVAESFVNQQLGRSDFESVAFPSYGYKASPFGSGYRFVSLSGSIMGGEALRASANRGWHWPYAGMQAVLPQILRLPFTADPSDEAILNLAGIQPIVYRDGNIVVWGERVPYSTGVYKFLHVRRIQSHYTRILAESRNLFEVLFNPNQPGVLDQVVLVLEQFARNEYSKGVLTQYLSFRQAVEISSEINSSGIITEADATNSLVTIINGRLQINFFYVPTGVVEVIEVTTGPQILVEKYGQFSS